MITFRQSLFLKFVDKTLLGLIAISAAYFYNRYIEDYRLENDYTTHIVQTRLDVLSTAWSMYYEIDALNSELFLILKEGVDKKLTTAQEFHEFIGPRANPILAEMRTKSANLFSFLDQNRFWLGDQLFLKINKHCVAYHKLIRAFFEQDDRTGRELSEMLATNKPDVDEFVAGLGGK